ncbi:E3 ubiquitin-protein ligase MBR2-like [Diospyros lotus]|uniref:E3 ubiquitin-protein ligase MBR2-like n=1 Tax=Diospyros lotus TaxID=55363 RepID=UPI002255DE2F|nr:E3 ubiquitin-protein ligase MBR2-like [Diospyros lotus]
MQGQRSAIGSLPETLGFDRGSASSDASLDEQIYWNNVQNSAHNVLPDYITSTGGTYPTSISQEGRNLSGWYVGEPSSSGTQSHVSLDERRVEHGWSSSRVTCGAAGPMSEAQQYGPANMMNSVSVNRNSRQIPNAPLFVRSSSNATQDIDMNSSAPVGHHDGCQIMDSTNAYKFDESENARMPTASSSSDPFGLPSGSVGYLAEENEGRPGLSLEGRRLSCKRKALEGNTGQSSMSGSSSYFQAAQNNVWHTVPAHAVPAQYNAASGLSIPTPSENRVHFNPSEQMNVRLGLGAGGTTPGSPLPLNVAENAENSQRNYRVRINPLRQPEDSIPVNVFPTGSNVRHSNVLSAQQQSPVLVSLNNSVDMRPPSAAENMGPQSQPLVLHPPTLRRTPPSSRWNAASSSRTGRSSSSGEGDAMLHEVADPLNMPRNISEHPVFTSSNGRRNSAQNSTTWSLAGGNASIAGNIASTSRTGSSSVVQPLPGPTWIPHRASRQYPRRLSELVRRSLLSSAGPVSGGQSSSGPPVQPVPSSQSQEMALPSGVGNQGHGHLSNSRSAILLERQLDGAFGVSYSLRALAAGSEGRSRLVSEIRNVLDLMRRGEGLRFEDVMILDQSVIFGMTDIYDRHRDMRLDVDNMSYEELLALEERIGNVNTGLSEETILKHLKQRKYFSIAMGSPLEVEPCCICQEEYNDGDDVGTLECGHEFHRDCIKQWLMHKNLCPICKTAAMNK